MATNGDNGDADLGNSETKSAKRPEGIRWVLTWNNYDNNDLITFGDEIAKISKGYIFGKEIGKSGTPHIQGYIEFNKKVRSTAILKINKHLHLDIAKGTQEQNIKYCCKDNNFITGGCFSHLKPLKLITNLYPWQIEILDIIKNEPDDRNIYWFYDEYGNIGKTQFSKYLAYHYKAIPLEGCKNDILYCAAQFESDIYIYDIERSLENYLSYGSIEKIKNGFYMCAKYESKPIIRNSPHILIFANFLPQIDKLSLDRWKIYEINDKQEKLKMININDGRLLQNLLNAK